MIPQRICLSCRNILPRTELIRIMHAIETGKVHLQPSKKLHGRSAYICYNKSCLLSCLKKGKLNKALRAPVPLRISEMLQKIAK